MTRKHNRIGLLLLTALFGAALVLSFACGREEESLKIVIEDDSPAKNTPPGDGDTGVPAKPETGIEPGPGPETAFPPEIGGGEATPGVTGSENGLTMKVSEVMAKAVDDEYFKKLAAAVPLRVMIFGRPENRGWSVRVMVRNTMLMEVVIDDNSGNILRRDVKGEEGIENLAEKNGPGAQRMKEHLESLSLGYAGALDAALKDERFPKIDYTKHIALTVLLGPGREGPTWHVVFMTGEEKKNIVAVIDDSGNVLRVGEEERRVMEGERGVREEGREIER